jgi:hypothetical protein
MRRKENKMSKRVQIRIQRKRHGQGTHQRGSEEGKHGSGMCVGNRREKVRR